MPSADLIPSRTFFNVFHILVLAPVIAWLGLTKGRDAPEWFWKLLVVVAALMAIFHAWRYVDKSNGLA